jgi:hypothetical protein
MPTPRTSHRDVIASPRKHQRGWIGLVALAIVGWLAMSAMKGYGVAGKAGADPASKAADPRERARAVESVVIDQAKDAARRLDEAERPKP